MFSLREALVIAVCYVLAGVTCLALIFFFGTTEIMRLIIVALGEAFGSTFASMVFVGVPTALFYLARLVHLNALKKPPGHFMAGALRFVFLKKSFETHFAPIIADMREEAFELDAEGKVWERRWKVAWYHVALVYSVAAVLVFGLLKKAVKLWQGV